MTVRKLNTVVAIESDRHAAATYLANFPYADVRCSTVEDQIDSLPDADWMLAGPPCQGFSNAGKGLGVDDVRNGWPVTIAAVDRVKPRMFLFENVPGMYRDRFMAHIAGCFKALDNLGYVVQDRVLDAVHYGVPQFRERVWWWGIRGDLYRDGMRHEWPKPTHQWPWPTQDCMFGGGLLPAVTVGLALNIPHIQTDGVLFSGDGVERSLQLQPHGFNEGGEQPIGEPSPTLRHSNVPGCSDIQVHQYRWSAAMLQRHPPVSPSSPACTVQSKWFKGGAEGLVEVLGYPAMTIASGNREPWPNEKYRQKFVRRLFPSECARLQSMPDDFAWPEKITKTAQYRIIGNGWACALAARFGESFRKVDPHGSSVLDLFAGGGLGAVGFHGRYWSHRR